MDIWLEIAKCTASWQDVVRIGGLCREVRQKMLDMCWTHHFVVKPLYRYLYMYMRWNFASVEYNGDDRDIWRRMHHVFENCTIRGIPTLLHTNNSNLIEWVWAEDIKMLVYERREHTNYPKNLQCFESVIATDDPENRDQRSWDRCEIVVPNTKVVYLGYSIQFVYGNYTADTMILDEVANRSFDIPPHVTTLYTLNGFNSRVPPTVKTIYTDDEYYSITTAMDEYPDLEVIFMGFWVSPVNCARHITYGEW